MTLEELKAEEMRKIVEYCSQCLSEGRSAIVDGGALYNKINKAFNKIATGTIEATKVDFRERKPEEDTLEYARSSGYYVDAIEEQTSKIDTFLN